MGREEATQRKVKENLRMMVKGNPEKIVVHQGL